MAVSTSRTLPFKRPSLPPAVPRAAPPGTVADVFAAFLRLGLTSFGGPIAHLAYFREEFVSRRRWISDDAYAELVSLCQFLPGPASSQVGIALGYLRAGLPGSIAAWLAFTLPSAALMTLFAVGLTHYGDVADAGWLHGLKVFAVAIVAHAVWGMGRALCPDFARRAIAVAVAAALLFAPLPAMQVAAMVLAGLAGAMWLRSVVSGSHRPLEIPVPRAGAGAALVVFGLLLAGLPALALATGVNLLELFSAFYRAGALVFGGGHVVLPLLQAELVPAGWITNDAFLAGYAAAQVVPGPLFTFAAFLGAAIPLPGGVAGAAIAVAGIFLPAFLLVLGALPFWQGLLQRPRLRAAVAGVNAGVVGILLAALITPVGSTALRSTADAALAVLALAALMTRRAPIWSVAAGCAIVGALMR
jgi:chromate transporter